MTKKHLEATAATDHILVLGRNFHVTDAIKHYTIKKIDHLTRLFQPILDVQVTLDVQKHEHRATILLHVGHTTVKVEGRSDDVYASLDKAINRLERKVKKYKDCLQDHHANPLSAVDMKVHLVESQDVLGTEEANNEIAAAEAAEWDILAKGTLPLRTYKNDEAIVQMDLSEAPFMVFRSAQDHKVKVIARRRDGHYSIIEPE